jgi:hypothetical protein
MKAHAGFNTYTQKIIPRNFKRENRALNGIDLASFPQDGLWRHGWSGRAWIAFKDGVLMAFGTAFTDMSWLTKLCLSFNGLKGSGFVDLGRRRPRAGDPALSHWTQAEALLVGKLEASRDVGEVILDEIEVTTAIIKKAVDVAEI